MGFMSVLSFAHKLISERLTLGDRAIDATVGTGADTLFLAKTTGARGEVYGFDIQAAALKLAEERLRLAREETSSLSAVTLLERSHAEMAEAVPAIWHGTVGAVMFNLGYLPSGDADKNIITQPDSSIAALEASLQLLRPGGSLRLFFIPAMQAGIKKPLLLNHGQHKYPL